VRENPAHAVSATAVGQPLLDREGSVIAPSRPAGAFTPAYLAVTHPDEP